MITPLHHGDSNFNAGLLTAHKLQPINTTITLSDANRIWDVIVVGAGPGGSVAARQLALLGSSVLLVDRASFPRSKVCGSCLNGNALATLDSLGLGHLIAANGAVPLRKFQLSVRKRTASLQIPTGVALSRIRLDVALVNAAIDAGAQFLPETNIVVEQNLTRNKKYRYVTARCGSGQSLLKARIVVAADGLGARRVDPKDPTRSQIIDRHSRVGAGVMLEKIHVPDWCKPGVVFMCCGKGGYVGLVVLEDGRLDVAAALDPMSLLSLETEKNQSRPGILATSIIVESGLPRIDNLVYAPWRGTTQLTRRPKQVADHRMFVIGDAAGYVEPFTGEGIAWALATGAAVAPLAHKASQQWQPAFVDYWCKSHAGLIGRRQRICRLMGQLLRHPGLVGLAVSAINIAPAIARPIFNQLNATTLDCTTNRRLPELA
ncbi:MAG: NAD(P)/FAD-dependent oxidoreductase [Planctomycetes bacterium]|nr:NAD(P)/FAD-dependent oxidoreductase [Planctomycetota bacterium]